MSIGLVDDVVGISRFVGALSFDEDAGGGRGELDGMAGELSKRKVCRLLVAVSLVVVAAAFALVLFVPVFAEVRLLSLRLGVRFGA